MADRASRDPNVVTTLLAVSLVDGISPVVLWADPITHRLLVSTVGSSVTNLPATGAVNGINAAFVFTQKPSFIVSDHAWYAPTNASGTTNWTWNAGTLTATMTQPPIEDIFGIA